MAFVRYILGTFVGKVLEISRALRVVHALSSALSMHWGNACPAKFGKYRARLFYLLTRYLSFVWGGAPHPTHPSYVTEDLAFEYHYFFTRKFCMAYYMQALVAAPGGFGTSNERAATDPQGESQPRRQIKHCQESQTPQQAGQSSAGPNGS